MSQVIVKQLFIRPRHSAAVAVRKTITAFKVAEIAQHYFNAKSCTVVGD
tara:strand:+ start:343 stop:489 length:147 start_codon:yes stop_codon:yes gene_type:complete